MKNRSKQLEDLSREIKSCKKCRLWKTRKNAVPGEGPFNAKLMFVGEAPGKNEDEAGRPFVGNAGKFLNKLFEKNKMKRENYFICGIVRCRPPDNRMPKRDEVEICTENYLIKQIKIINPEIVVLLGKVALECFFNGKISECHGELIHEQRRWFFPMYHPSAGMRFPKTKKKMEKDFEKLNLFTAKT